MKINLNAVDFYYGETIFKRIETLKKQDLLVFSEPIIYEKFQTKLATVFNSEWLLAPEGFDYWEMMQELSGFIAKRTCVDLLIIGNEKVMNLGLFVSTNSKIDNCYLMPTEFEFLSDFIAGKSVIIDQSMPVLQNILTPKWVDFDFQLFEHATPNILIPFETLIERYFFDSTKDFNKLYFEFNSRDLLNHHSLYTYVSQVCMPLEIPMDFLKLKLFLIDYFNRIMEIHEIKLTALLLFLYLSKKHFNSNLNLENLVKWLNYIGYHLKIPENLSFTRLIDQLVLSFDSEIELWNRADGRFEKVKLEKIEILTHLSDYRAFINEVINI